MLELELIGSGERKKKYDYLIQKYNLQGEVSFSGNKSQWEIREKMREAHFLVFASDFREGWGAVVNEAMNSLCAVSYTHLPNGKEQISACRILAAGRLCVYPQCSARSGQQRILPDHRTCRAVSCFPSKCQQSF